MRTPRLVLCGVVAALALPSAASAATLNGITPVAPAKNGKVKRGKAATFKLKLTADALEGDVFVQVCKSKAKDAEGLICSKESLGQASASGSLLVYRAKFFDFPAFWLSRPGRYYWQAHIINCSVDVEDCKLEGPIVPFRVVR